MSEEESSENALIQSARALKLSDPSVALLKRYKRTETDIFYTYSGTLSPFLTLPQTEQGLFLSLLELATEKCVEHQYEVPALADQVSILRPDAGKEADATDSGSDSGSDFPGGVEGRGSEAGDDPFESDEASASDKANYTVFDRDRNTRQVRTQVQPTAFFGMWLRGMKMQCERVLDLDESLESSA